jgi:transposase
MVRPKKKWITRDDPSLSDLIKRFHHERNIEFHDRIHAVIMLEKGFEISFVAEILDRTEKTIRNWANAYKEGGLAGLESKKNDPEDDPD